MSSMFGKMLNQLRTNRMMAREQVITELCKRNGINRHTPGYKLEEVQTVRGQGKEIVEYRLYKLLDYAATTISADFQLETEHGLEAQPEEKAKRGA